MKSSGFEVALFPYESIVAAFGSIGINAAFDEETPDAVFQKTIDQIDALEPRQWSALKQHLVNSNSQLLKKFFDQFQATLDRQIEQIILIPLHGHQNEFENIEDAIAFVSGYKTADQSDGVFRKYEILVKYTNGDKIEADFKDEKNAVAFLRYVQQGAAQ